MSAMIKVQKVFSFDTFRYDLYRFGFGTVFANSSVSGG